MYDFFVIGDIMLDHVVIISDPEIVRTVDEAAHTITIPFPTKIQLNTPPQIFMGGNAFNAANTLAKLGLKVGMYSLIGKDPEGDSIMNQLKEAGINSDLVQQEPGSTTNKSLVLNIAKDRVVFSHHHVRKYSLTEMPEAKYVYLTSIGEDDMELLKQVAEQKVQKGFHLVFSPGTRQIQEPFEDVKPVLEQTDILVLNKREAMALSRLKTDSDENLLQGLHRMGPKAVVITRSSKGSIAFDGQNIIKAGALQSDGVDTTGAGDTYSATLMAALSYGKDLKTAMEWGAINSANVISAMGATNGLLDIKALEALHAEKVSQLQYIESPVVAAPSGEQPITQTNPTN